MMLYPYFSQHLLYPLYERVSSRHFLDKLTLLERSQWWDHETLREYQWKKIKILLNHAFKNNAFYRRRFEESDVHPERIKDFTDLAKIPVLTKDDIVKNLPDMISDGYSSKTLVRDNTSGSTGKNLTFYTDRNTLDWMTAAVLRHMAWYNIGFGDRRVILWGSLANDSVTQRLYMACRNFLLREQIISSYQLDARTMTSTVRLLRRKRPKALIGYVSALNILADFIYRNQIADIEVDAIIPAAETLFDHQRKLFEHVYHGKVFNRYGCHEFTSIAHECSFHSGMHINSENLYVEIIKDGRAAQPGELGEIVITDLENFGMPFIRYRMEDLGVLQKRRCLCGRGLPLLERVEGRIYDLISCPNGTVQTGTFFCKMTRSVEGIREFQVVQHSKEKLRMKLVTDDHFQVDSVAFLRNQIKVYCGDTMDVDFELVDHIEPLKSGKRRYVVSLDNMSQSSLN
jgi:phenylacetate-CoA ligase